MLQFNRVFGLAEIPPRDVRGMNKKHRLNGKDRVIRNRQKMCTTLYTTNPTWATVSLKSGLRGKAISTDRHGLTSDSSGNVKTHSRVVFKNALSFSTSVLKKIIDTSFENSANSKNSDATYVVALTIISGNDV